MFPVSLDFPCLIAPSVVSNVYLPVSLDCLFLIGPSILSNIYVASFSGLFMFDCPFGFL